MSDAQKLHIVRLWLDAAIAASSPDDRTLVADDWPIVVSAGQIRAILKELA